jgi:hypothetical protein
MRHRATPRFWACYHAPSRYGGAEDARRSIVEPGMIDSARFDGNEGKGRQRHLEEDAAGIVRGDWIGGWGTDPSATGSLGTLLSLA